MAVSITLTSGPDLWSPATPETPLTKGVLLTALQGDDTVTGTNFSDEIYGGQDNDIITGGAGNDTLLGNAGDDTLRASSGDNTIYGGQGNDYIIGGTGKDLLLGNLGNDTIEVISSDTTVFGGQGEDVIVSRFSNNFVYSNKDNDTIIIEGTNTFAHGGQGDDNIILEVAGPTTLIGGAGNDLFEIETGVAGPGLVIRGGTGDDGLTPDGLDMIMVNGDNDFSSSTITDIASIEVVMGATGIFSATTFSPESESNTLFSGAGAFQLTGTPEEIMAAFANITVKAGTMVKNEAGETLEPSTIGLSAGDFGFPTTLTEFFIIDGSQFAPEIARLYPDATPEELTKLNIGALSAQFGVITISEANAIRLNPGADIPEAVQDKIVAFGEMLNDSKYIPQVTLEQSDTLLSGFYDLILENGITPVNNRFFSVLDTKGTTVTTDDITTLYFSADGQFDLGTSTVVTESLMGFSGYTPSNPITPPAILSLETISASTELVPIA